MMLGAGVIRSGGDVLFVHEQAPQDTRRFWVLLGSQAEAGELRHETLVREDTRLLAVQVDHLLCSMRQYWS
jgi:hypothetical protein